jgi:hypothetical protein
MMWALIGGILAMIPALVVGKPYARYMAPLALPGGLCAWAVMSGRMDQLLLDNPGVAARASLFHRLILDAIGWALIVLAGNQLISFLLKSTAKMADDPLYSELSSSKPNTTSQSKRKKTKNDFLANPYAKVVVSVCLASLIAILLVKMLAQSGKADYRLADFQQVTIRTVPATKQIIFAVLVAFAAGVFAAHQLFSISLGWFFLSPLLVAVIAYFFAGQSWALEPLAANTSPVLLSSVSFAAILPVQYVGVGSLAVIAGYWISIYTNQVRLQHVK